MRRFLWVAVFLSSSVLCAQLVINNDRPVYTTEIPFTISGTALPNMPVEVTLEGATQTVTSGLLGNWTVTWNAPLQTGTYEVTVRSGGSSATQLVRVQRPGPLPRQSGIEEAQPRYADPDQLHVDNYQEMTDRWRIAPPPYELDEKSRGVLDPYNKNIWKGDFPIRGNDTFLVLTGISDTLAETRSVPTPSGVSSARPTSFPFFGEDDQSVVLQSFIVSADLFEGNTAFQPVRQRIKATLIGNINHVRVDENAIVKPDVRRGTTRTDSHVALQELFYERKLRDLTPNYDFASVRVGSQPFSSDFRGFIFNDTNLGVRLFGNYAANRFQYNLAYFNRLEKDTNSGLNTLNEFRDQQVGIVNFYWQDFVWRGYTQQFSIHAMRDDASFHYDRNGILQRPAPVGVFEPHDIRATYIGEAGLGHIGRINVDHALYYVFGRDSLNPIAGPDPELRDGEDRVRIGAGMAAVELSYDRDWIRPRVALFYATGDDDPRDRDAGGFDSIFDSPAFAGGGFSFFNRLGIRLPPTGVALVERGSLLPSLRSSKDEGQPNYVNPGIQLASVGVDLDVTPRFKTILTANYIRLDKTEPLEAILFQGDIAHELGVDLSVGLKYRPLLSNNIVIVGGAAAFIPGRGFKDIYEDPGTLFHAFTNVILTF